MVRSWPRGLVFGHRAAAFLLSSLRSDWLRHRNKSKALNPKTDNTSIATTIVISIAIVL
ncbi:hypothetical protein [Pontibacter burrus]|uniref:Uncharacterized protein n=1 Tax=Pontibacter burrus TaxID=2704466 RepID=A0A6B3LSP5_9BACT|nr:hypothetical protein [Pontibacter burrus]NEM96514.1 hypothetical protein [Pontibacter burrus]